MGRKIYFKAKRYVFSLHELFQNSGLWTWHPIIFLLPLATSPYFTFQLHIYFHFLFPFSFTTSYHLYCTLFYVHFSFPL
jgi:hypothetical protein